MQNECLVPKSTFFKITLWGLPATQKALNNCFYMRSKLDMVWKSLGCACKQQSWYVGDHQYGQFYWREKKKRKEEISLSFLFSLAAPYHTCWWRENALFPLLSFFYCSTLPDHIESQKSWIYIHPVVEGEKQNKTSDHKQLIWSNLIRPVLLPPAGQGVTAQSAMQRLRRHFFQGNSAFP